MYALQRTRQCILYPSKTNSSSLSAGVDRKEEGTHDAVRLRYCRDGHDDRRGSGKRGQWLVAESREKAVGNSSF